MSPATKLPNSTAMKFFDWKGKPVFTRNPAIEDGGTYSLYWSIAPLDENEAIITGAFLVTGVAKSGQTYTFWVPASAVSADGLSATGCVGGIRPNGLDYTTGDTDFAPASDTILAGGRISCGIPAVLGELVRSAIQGVIQTGSATLDLGTGASEDVYIKHNGNPWLKQTSAGVAQYYNGSSYVSLNDSIASSLVKVSATDTTPDYLYGKVGSSDGSIVFDITGDGADETLDMITALPARISSHAIYTPAYMTGGTSAETTIALWDSVTDGSFRLTLDGVTLNVTGINFTGITTMAQVASTIQTKLRTACGTTPTVVWSTNKFIITSSVTTSASAVSVLTTATASVGTDISGAGAGTWMDAESGRGTATAAVLDPTQDTGKVGLLNARGSFPADLARDFVDPLGYQGKGGIMVATGANAVDELTVGQDNFGLRADSSQSTGVKWAPCSRYLTGITTPVTLSNTTTETDLLSVSIPANTLSTNNAIKGELDLSQITSAAGTANDLFIKLKYGGTTIAQLNFDNGSIPSDMFGRIFFRVQGSGTTSSQKGRLDAWIQRGSSGMVTSANTIDFTAYSVNLNNSSIYNEGTSAIDTTSAQTLVITGKWNNASASNILTISSALVEVVA